MSDPGRRSTSELVRDVADDVQQLVRKEIELARAELLAAVLPKLRGAGLIAAAFIVTLPGLLFLAVAIALALPVSPAMGFGIVGGVMLLAAAAAILLGLRMVRKRREKVALESIKEDVAWARRRLKR